MKRTLICELPSSLNTEVRVCGFVDTIRAMKRNQFVVLRDHTGKVQLYIDAHGKPELASIVGNLTQESTIEAVGTAISNQSVKLGGLEVAVSELKVVSTAKPELPICKDSTLDVRLDWRYLDLRQPEKLLIFKIQTVAEQAMREFWTKNGFLEIHSPKLMATASESGSELFHLPYFGGTAYLSQSPQFYKQMAMNAGFDRVFEIGPVFRANPSFTSRHDTEFTSVDCEISWIDSFADVMAFEENWVNFFMSQIKEKLGSSIEELYGKQVIVPSVPFPRITIKEAKKIIRATGYKSEKDDDLEPEEERLLSGYVKETYDHDWVFVTDYPVTARPFYHMRNPQDQTLTCSFDLLYKGLEVTSGAQREHRYDVLKAQILEKQVSNKDPKLLESLEHYLRFFEYGTVPHGGYGFGLTRMIMKLLDLSNVREVTYLYRGPKRLTP
ncbi:MAG: aspartate--tRNA(Asn) ligase [Oscillospiraceae bacterium]|nr:aspartate--tRNA(Asn) ligase [Oscillospiraceae bacterium]